MTRSFSYYTHGEHPIYLTFGMLQTILTHILLALDVFFFCLKLEASCPTLFLRLYVTCADAHCEAISSSVSVSSLFPQVGFVVVSPVAMAGLQTLPRLASNNTILAGKLCFLFVFLQEVPTCSNVPVILLRSVGCNLPTLRPPILTT